MTDSVDNLSIDEILTSIKKYMSDEKQPHSPSITGKSSERGDAQKEQSTNNISDQNSFLHNLNTSADSLISCETPSEISSQKKSSQIPLPQSSQFSFDEGAIRLNPVFEETLSPSEDFSYDTSLPSFIQHERKSSLQENQESSPASSCSTNSINDSTQRQPSDKSNAATVDSFKNFIQGVGQIIHQTSPDSQKCGLDTFVQKEIKRAVDTWIKDNMASFVQVIVQKSVEKELKQITDTLLNPSIKNL